MKTNFRQSHHRFYLSIFKHIPYIKEVLTTLFFITITMSGYAQRNKDIIPVVYCVKDLTNGLHQASFSYTNPTRKDVTISEDASIVKTNNGKRVAKGLNKFKAGTVNKVFTKEFGPGDYVEWTIISNGNTHTVIANANSSKKCVADDGFIFPVYGQGNGKSEDIIGQELGALVGGLAGDTPDPLIYQINNDKVLIEIVPIAGNMTILIGDFNIPGSGGKLKDDFGVQDTDYLIDRSTLTGLAAIDVYFPINRLLDLNNYTNEINFVRILYPSNNNSTGDGFTGNAISQGDATQTSDVVRESFKLINGNQILPVDGTGITIGVMSNSYDTQPFSSGNLSQSLLDVLAGDLPGIGNTHGYTLDVDVIKEYPFGKASDEGRAMLHIIHDVAPGAKLAFHTGSLSPRNFEVGFNALALKSDFIVDDITFITEPFFGKSRISAAIEAFTDDNHMHFTSAGNFANSGYQGVFNATTTIPINNNFLEGTARAHIFDGSTGDYLQKIGVKGGETYMIVLQWADPFASQNNVNGAGVDLDFYIVDDSGRLLVGNNRSNENGDAVEIMVFTATADGEANILITSANGATNVPFRYIAFRSSGLTLIEYNAGTPTITGHAMTDKSVTIGAIRFNKTDAEAFSSYGGTLSDGTAVGVDFAAPDGVNTNVGSIGVHKYVDGTDVDGDIFKNFFGTSAAVPSAAAAVALLHSALPTWYPNGYNGNVIQLFKSNAKGSVNPIQAGAGMIDVNKVFNSLASQTARITSFTIVNNQDGTTPIASADTIKINVIGNFFPPAPSADEPNPIKFYLDGVELTASIKGDGSVEVTIPPFSGNPDLQIYTEPKVGSVNNGGFSEPYKFFQDGKIALTVTANPVTIKFGEDYKSKLTYNVKGIADNQIFEDIFPTVVFSTIVDGVAYPDVKNYPVTPSFNGEPYDTDKYQVNFKNGDLVIEKNNLIITPKDITTAKYGEKITVELLYSGYGTTNDVGVESFNLINNPEAFLSKIKGEHLKDFYKDGTTGITPVGLINNFKSGETFDPNGVDRYQDILNLLEHGSFISSENTFINRLEQVPYRGGSYPVNSGYTERVYGSVNTDLGSGFINFNPLDFTAYLDEFAPDKSIENGQALGIINGQALGIINGQALGIINGQALGIINGQAIGIVNGQAFGIVNDQALAIVNGQAFAIVNGQAFAIVNNDSGLGSGFDTNDYNKVFSIIDTSDYSAECLTEGNCTVSKYYALNLITGVEATNSNPQYIYPGTFINPMSDNFNIIYQKAELTVAKKDLTVKTTALSMPYGGDIRAKITTEFDYAYDDNTENVFPEGIPYYFKKVNGGDTEYNIGDPIKMSIGVYDIFIKDEADNYTVVYDVSHGQLTINEAPLTVNTTVALNINYGGTPEINTNITGFAPDEEVTTVFPDDKGGIPYFFMKLGETPDCGTCIKYYLPYIEGADKMNVGVYNIFIKDDPNDNYKIEYAVERGTLTVEAAALIVNTTAFALKYGDSVSDAIATKTTITGFALDEDVTTVFPNGIPYLFVKGTEAPLDIADVKELGTYMIEVEAPTSGNYVIDYGSEHGDLTITEAILTFTAISESINYGETPIIDLIFIGFAPGEDATVLEVGGMMPYYFIKDGIEYFLGDKKDVGVYDVSITDNPNDNYIFSPDVKLGNLTIEKATLNVSITLGELIVNQGEIPQFTATITGYKNGDIETEVFPVGIPYEFVDGYGDNYYNTDVPGVFTVQITEPTNYTMAYASVSTLFVNPFNDYIKKVRIYSDCVSYNSPGDYTVTYRYENDNDEPVFAALGADNNLSGPAAATAIGELPTIFMPGSGTFEINFNGGQLVWSLITYGSTHNSSVSSASTSGSGECDAKLDGAYTIGPNPVTDILNIKQNIAEVSKVDIYNMYGLLVIKGPSFNGTYETKPVDMSNLDDGLYIVRIVSATSVNTYNILKQ